MSQCACVAVHSYTGRIECSREGGWKGGPQSRRANALPFPREKHKIKAECCLNVYGRKNCRERNERERERER